MRKLLWFLWALMTFHAWAGTVDHFKASPKNTYGYSLMTPLERKELQTKMRHAGSIEECMAYAEEQHALMEKRAREQKRQLPERISEEVCQSHGRGQ